MTEHTPRPRKPRPWFLTAATFVLALLTAGITLDRLLARDSTYSYLKLFNEVLLLVERNYVEETEVTGLMRGAYDGLLSSLDPESEYLTKDQYQRLTAVPSQDEGNVGMALGRRGGYVFVVSVVPGSPAAEAGFVTGTRLRRIEGVSTREMTLTEARLMLRGKVGTQVSLERFPQRDGSESTAILSRARLDDPSPRAERTDVALVLRVPRLAPGSAAQARRALTSLERAPHGKLLLDLRGTSEGDYEEAARLASLFLPDGEVGRIQSRGGEEEVLEVRGEPLGGKLEVALLVDLGTAGPGELLAQALRTRLGAEILGSRTFGRASLQDFIPLGDGGMIRLSVARCLGPGGESWEKEGLEPDHPVQADADADPDEDSILERALEILAGVETPELQAA